MIPLAALGAALLLMAGELWRSRLNERALRARGAREPADDVCRAMAWAYPACFLGMAGEGLLTVVGQRFSLEFPVGQSFSVAFGVLIFIVAKLLKVWAIASLGSRWSFRVLVEPRAPLVATGPYAWIRHPNYVAVVGEMVGFALVVAAPIAGIASVAGFGVLLWMRIRVEERALGIGGP